MRSEMGSAGRASTLDLRGSVGLYVGIRPRGKAHKDGMVQAHEDSFQSEPQTGCFDPNLPAFATESLLSVDKTFNVKFQGWMVEGNPPKEVKAIEGADHMAMLSEPDEVCSCLLEIAQDYR
ncbi:hypothetical protein MLD38_004616 [Melastoma candidum]|uniref:Uncharacterized protein n=1 Tax=Melastoma candidum TaxID=119954 RepID=A0ACB9SEU9_9MYRT|nr:hypothetical protein MLD38_004616 [Melastoma candidum]